ncbi:MAG: putative translation initiation inhibitor, YjgF family [Solirubrobacterales bacterium]|jgi:2-iminobutanoate/2-iminopropanoate deaminase|nr:putative translation initiation inhibitor, YjgF family [Solirubrobacterales bacterium]
MTVKFLNPADQPDFARYGLSLGVATETLVFAAGMACDTENGTRMKEAKTITDETRICLEMVDATLREAGCTLRDVVKTTCYLHDRHYYAEFVEAYREFFGEGPYPSRCTFYVGIGGDCRVEIDAIAVRGAGAQLAAEQGAS